MQEDNCAQIHIKLIRIRYFNIFEELSDAPFGAFDTFSVLSIFYSHFEMPGFSQ